MASADRPTSIPIGDEAIPAKLPRARSGLFFRHLIAIVLIAGAALGAYSNTFHAPFHFDDRPNITLNPDVQIEALTWDRVERLVGNTYPVSIRVFSYLTLALNYYFGRFDVFGYHLVNFCVHAAAGFLVYWLLMLTFRLPSLRGRYGRVSYKAALFAALIFIAHPVQTQSVTYIVQRMASMAGMFYLLSLVLYIKGRSSSGLPRAAYLAGCGLAYLIGVFTKENVAILPLTVALYEFYFFQNLDLGPKGKKALLLLGGGLFVLGVLGAMTWGGRYLGVISEGYPYRPFTMFERLLTQPRVVFHYLTLLLYPLPSRLNLDYDFAVSRTIVDPPATLLSILALVAVIGFSLRTAKARPVVSFFILWYFVNLAIESSVFPLEMVFEHRLYLPAVGPFVLFSLSALRGIEKLKERLLPREWALSAAGS